MRPLRLSALVALILCAAFAPLARAQVWDWNPNFPDAERDTVPLHVDAPDSMAICLGGVPLGDWMPELVAGDFMVRPGTYIAHGQKTGSAYITYALTVEAGTDTASLRITTAPDIVGRWRGTFDGARVTWEFSPLECLGNLCNDQSPPDCGIIGRGDLPDGPCIADAIMYFPGDGLFMMRYGAHPEADPAHTRILTGWLSDDGTLQGFTRPVDDPSNGADESLRQLFVLDQVFE